MTRPGSATSRGGFSGTDRKAVVHGRRIMQREAMKGVECVYWADEPILLKGADGGIPSRVLLAPTPT